MRKVLLMLLSSLLFYGSVKAERTDSIVSRILVECENKNWNNVLELFEPFAQEDPYNAEVFYWLRASKNEAIRYKVLYLLAKSYHLRNNTEKTVLMYKELVLNTNPPISVLLEAADIVINLGDIKVSQLIYLKILEKDPLNFPANLFLGNFIFLRAEREKTRLEYQYKMKKKPTRMEYAAYRKQCIELFELYYKEARRYLKIALSQKSSVELKNTLREIDELEKILK